MADLARWCSVEGCDRLDAGRGLCRGHAARVERNGARADLKSRLNVGGKVGSDLPNPWHEVSPPCPYAGHPSLRVYLWHPDPEDGAGRWVCIPCGRRFDVA